MKYLLRLEESGQMALSGIALYFLPLHLSWWAYILLFFAPDLSMASYAAGAKAGAWLYNLAHHKLAAALLIIAGLFLKEDYCILAGLIIWAHASFDRMLGYGLKYEDAFGHTHLGWIGKTEYRDRQERPL